jgi:hypothetical protein
MPTYRITSESGETSHHTFSGTIQQFVQSHFCGRGVPSGSRVSEATDYVVTTEVSTPVESVVEPVAVVRKPTRKKGESNVKSSQS